MNLNIEVEVMIKGDKCWIIENGLKITEVEILSFNGNLVLIRAENGKTLRLPRHRLYDSKEEAGKYLKSKMPTQKKDTI